MSLYQVERTRAEEQLQQTRTQLQEKIGELEHEQARLKNYKTLLNYVVITDTSVSISCNRLRRLELTTRFNRKML